MSGVGSENAGRAWLLANVAGNSSIKHAVTAIAKLNRQKKPKRDGPAKEWYIVRADELASEAEADLMIVVDADLPQTLDAVVELLGGQAELDIIREFRVKVEELGDGKWRTFHHPKNPHQGDWDEVEKPLRSGSSSSGGANLSDPKDSASPRPNPLNPWG